MGWGRNPKNKSFKFRKYKRLHYWISYVLWKYTSDNKTLFLKPPHAWVMDHRDVKLVLAWKPQPFWSVFIILVWILGVLTTGGEKVIIYLTLLWIMQVTMTGLARYAHYYNKSTNNMGVGVANHLLIGF